MAEFSSVMLILRKTLHPINFKNHLDWNYNFFNQQYWIIVTFIGLIEYKIAMFIYYFKLINEQKQFELFFIIDFYIMVFTVSLYITYPI